MIPSAHPMNIIHAKEWNDSPAPEQSDYLYQAHPAVDASLNRGRFAPEWKPLSLLTLVSQPRPAAMRISAGTRYECERETSVNKPLILYGEQAGSARKEPAPRCSGEKRYKVCNSAWTEIPCFDRN